jgi:hypothetical protein
MAEHASPITSARIAGRTYLAVTDLLSMLDDLARSMTGPGQTDRAAGSVDTCARLADLLRPLVQPAEPVPDRPLPLPQPCTDCQQPVRVIDRLTPGEQVTLDSDRTRYGAWMTLTTVNGHKAAPYDRTKHASYNIARYREHHCPATTQDGTDA